MTDVRLHPVVIRLRYRGVQERPGVLVEGPMGWGEWSPVPGFACDPEQAWRAALEAATEPWPAPARNQIAVNALVSDDAAAIALDPSTRAVKIKVGDAGDVDRVALVRDRLGSTATIRIDANGVWDIDTAVARLAAMARYDLEFVEQPVATIEDLAALRRRVPIPVVADECIRSLDDIDELRRQDAADAVVVKVQACGGVSAALEWVERAGIPAIVTSMLETSVGLAAGVACAAALPALPFACGLGTGSLLINDVVDDALVSHDGVLDVRRPEVSHARLAECAASALPPAFVALQERIG